MTSKSIEGPKSLSNFSVNPTLSLMDYLLMLPSLNRFINGCARKKKEKILESQNHRVFFVRYRRNYVLNNISRLSDAMNIFLLF